MAAENVICIDMEEEDEEKSGVLVNGLMCVYTCMYTYTSTNMCVCVCACMHVLELLKNACEPKSMCWHLIKKHSKSKSKPT